MMNFGIFLLNLLKQIIGHLVVVQMKSLMVVMSTPMVH